MKKQKIIKLLIALFLLATAVFVWNYNRYKISEPMQDLEYKKTIIKASHNPFYKLENLRPLVGEEELLEFIKSNNENSQIYTPSSKNIKNGIFRANLHTHTLNSDGKVSVKFRMDYAQNYAEKNLKDGFMYIAITDHNTVLGAKDVIKVLQKNPNKYKNIKIITGIEIYTKYKTEFSKKPVEIHVLTWCINPYDKFLNKEFYKKNLKDKANRGTHDREFTAVIKMMSKYGIPGIAHPLRYTVHLKDKKYKYIDTLFKEYSSLSQKPLFTEGHYQVYDKFRERKYLGREYDKYKIFINKTADKYNIIKTGSTDAHGYTIFDWF